MCERAAVWRPSNRAGRAGSTGIRSTKRAFSLAIGCEKGFRIRDGGFP